MQRKFTIDEVKNRLQISARTIKKWELFFELESKTDDDGVKCYSSEVVATFENIKKLMAQGYLLEDIGSILNLTSSLGEDVPSEQKCQKVEVFAGKVENEIMVKPLINQIERAQSAIYDLFMEKTRFIEQTAAEKTKLMAKIEILEFQKQEIELNKGRMISFLENQINEYKELLGLKDKAIRQMESHLADYARIKGGKKWWHRFI